MQQEITDRYARLDAVEIGVVDGLEIEEVLNVTNRGVAEGQVEQ